MGENVERIKLPEFFRPWIFRPGILHRIIRSRSKEHPEVFLSGRTFLSFTVRMVLFEKYIDIFEMPLPNRVSC